MGHEDLPGDWRRLSPLSPEVLLYINNRPDRTDSPVGPLHVPAISTQPAPGYACLRRISRRGVSALRRGRSAVSLGGATRHPQHDVAFTKTMTSAVHCEIKDLAQWLDVELVLPG